MEQWTNLWKWLFATDNAKCLTVKRLEIPNDQDLTPTTGILECSDSLLLMVTDWEGEVAKWKSHSEGEAGSLGKEIAEDGSAGRNQQTVEGGSAGGNPSKRWKKQDAKNGAKRRKVLSNPIIEDDSPESSLAHSSTPLPLPPLPLPPLAIPPPDSSLVDLMPMDTTGFDFSTLDLDFSQFLDLVVSEHQDLLQSAQHGATL